MPVPIPRQRAIPAVESGQAQAAQRGGPSTDQTPHKEATVDNHAATTNLTLLLIEDDPGGATVIPELQDSAGRPIRVRTARNLTEAARLLTDDVHCILLDLALPAPGRGGDDESSPCCGMCWSSRPGTPSSRSPRPVTPNAAPKRCASAPRTTFSGMNWTAGC